eukprot:10866020-Prorocentrum_lima.AAC.1
MSDEEAVDFLKFHAAEALDDGADASASRPAQASIDDDAEMDLLVLADTSAGRLAQARQPAG